MIRRLAQEVVDRIAAGEVIERPVSVVKELLENALDAGARRIDVEIERGGKRLIRVQDDGCGMDRADLCLAFAPHATSKLSALDDLLAIASYGFRGEALASIGAVARARLVSRPAGAEEAFEIACTGGATGEPRPCGAPPGTLVEVQHLFFNVPARARFLKGDAAEASRCLDQVIQAALAADGVAFSMKSDGRVLFQAAAAATRRERLESAYGRDLAAGAIAASGPSAGMHVEALLGRPDAARARAARQHTYVNGRLVKDGTLRAALRQAYHQFLSPALQPSYLLFLSLDPAEVDVNVHPAKTEVRFRDAARVFRAVHHVVLEALRGADLAPRPGAEPGAAAAGVTAPARRFLGFPRGVWERPLAPAPAAPAVETTAPPAGAAALPARTGRRWLTLFRTYLLFQAEDELVVVDQHALHERVLFERLRQEQRAAGIRSQRLLVPEIVEVGRPEVLRAEEMGEEFARLGLEVTALGETALAVHAVPALLQGASARELLLAALESETSAGAEAREPLERALMSMACRAAVKAGTDLAEEEIAALLDQAAALPETQACPHGRPTSIRFAAADLERWFKRAGF